MLTYALTLAYQGFVVLSLPCDNNLRAQDMVDSEQNVLLQLWDMNVCPQCGKDIPEGTRVGSGRRSEGGFCSLSCYADFYGSDLIERAKRAAALAARRQN